MFSSFKEKLNTSLSTLQEKGLSTTLSTTHATTSPGTGPSLDTGRTGAGIGQPVATHVVVDSRGAAGTETAPSSEPGNVVVLPIETTDLTSLASPHSPTPSVPPHQQQSSPPPLQQHQGSFVSIASRISSGASSSSLFFRRPLQATRSTADLMAVGTSTTSSSSLPLTTAGTTYLLDSASGVSSPNRLAILVQKLTLDPQEEKANPAELDRIRDFYNQQQQQQPSGTELSTVVIEKLEILRRYEARFPGEKNSNSSSSSSFTSPSSKSDNGTLKKKGTPMEEDKNSFNKAGVCQMNPNEHKSELKPMRKSRLPRGMLLPPELSSRPLTFFLPLTPFTLPSTSHSIVPPFYSG